MMKRVVKDPEERRKELIDTAERLFITAGYDQTAISDIVREVNVSQGAYYYYFDSKEDVLVAILERNIASMERALKQIADRDDLDEAAKLNAMINQFVSLTASGKKILNYIHQENNATLKKKLLKIKSFSRIAPLMAEVISKGVEKGRFDVSRPLETSYLLVILLASALRIFTLPETASDLKSADRANRENIQAALEDLLSRALGAHDYKFSLKI
ncbi:MAG: TetR/AcrR family transcriptional regulator [Methanotrichaceae archaeon]